MAARTSGTDQPVRLASQSAPAPGEGARLSPGIDTTAFTPVFQTKEGKLYCKETHLATTPAKWDWIQGLVKNNDNGLGYFTWNIFALIGRFFGSLGLGSTVNQLAKTAIRESGLPEAEQKHPIQQFEEINNKDGRLARMILVITDHANGTKGFSTKELIETFHTLVTTTPDQDQGQALSRLLEKWPLDLLTKLQNEVLTPPPGARVSEKSTIVTAFRNELILRMAALRAAPPPAPPPPPTQERNRPQRATRQLQPDAPPAQPLRTAPRPLPDATPAQPPPPPPPPPDATPEPPPPPPPGAPEPTLRPRQPNPTIARPPALTPSAVKPNIWTPGIRPATITQAPPPPPAREEPAAQPPPPPPPSPKPPPAPATPPPARREAEEWTVVGKGPKRTPPPPTAPRPLTSSNPFDLLQVQEEGLPEGDIPPAAPQEERTAKPAEAKPSKRQQIKDRRLARQAKEKAERAWHRTVQEAFGNMQGPDEIFAARPPRPPPPPPPAREEPPPPPPQEPAPTIRPAVAPARDYTGLGLPEDELGGDFIVKSYFINSLSEALRKNDTEAIHAAILRHPGWVAEVMDQAETLPSGLKSTSRFSSHLGIFLSVFGQQPIDPRVAQALSRIIEAKINECKDLKENDPTHLKMWQEIQRGAFDEWIRIQSR